MTFNLPEEWRTEIEKSGTPLYLDTEHGEQYVLLEVIVEANKAGGYRAHPNTLAIYGKGKTKRKAIDDLHKNFSKLSRDLKPTLIHLKQTSECAPAQWEGRTSDDRPVLIRGRHGVLSVRMGPIRGSIDDAVRGEEMMHLEHEDAEALSSSEMVCLLSSVFDFSKVKENMI